MFYGFKTKVHKFPKILYCLKTISRKFLSSSNFYHYVYKLHAIVFKWVMNEN